MKYNDEAIETSLMLALGSVVSAMMFNGTSATEIRTGVEIAIRTHQVVMCREQAEPGKVSKRG